MPLTARDVFILLSFQQIKQDLTALEIVNSNWDIHDIHIHGDILTQLVAYKAQLEKARITGDRLMQILIEEMNDLT